MKCPICSNKLEDDELKLDVCDNGHSAKDVILFLKKQFKLLKNGMLEMKRTLKQLDRKFYSYDDAEWVMDGIDDILRKAK